MQISTLFRRLLRPQNSASRVSSPSLSRPSLSLFALGLASWGLVTATPAQAAQPNGQPDGPTQASSVRFKPTNSPPPNRGTLRTPYGTGSRGDCPNNPELPELTQLAGNAGMELTVSSHPTFWVYVPYTSSEVSAGKFSLQENDVEIYKADVTLPETPGIIGIADVEMMPPLDVGKRYQWYFEISCSLNKHSEAAPEADQENATAETNYATVTGRVERVVASSVLADAVDAADSPLEIVSAYAENHIWYETLTRLITLRLNNPDEPSLDAAWEDVLTDPNVGLAAWSTVPIVGEVISVTPIE